MDHSSADSFATDLITTDLNSVRPTYTPVSLSLASAANQNLTAITFRIYSYAPATGNSVDYDDMVLNGDVVAVPESSGALLALLGVLSLMTRRRTG